MIVILLMMQSWRQSHKIP